MAEIISGLFGVSPELLQQQRAQQDMIRAQQIAQTQRNPIGAAIGLQFGQSLGRGLLGGLGFQDPELQRATQLQNVLQETQAQLGQEGLADTELLYTTLANNLNNAGFAKEAVLTAIQGQGAVADYRKGVAERTKLGAETTLSLAKAQKELQPKLDDIEVLFSAKDRLNKDDPNYQTKLEAIDSKIENEVSNLKLEENVVRINQKIANGTATAEDRELLKSLEGYQTRVKKAGKAETNISLGGPQISPEKLAEEAGKLVGKDVAGIEGKYQALDSVADALSLVDAGINAGFYGPTKQFVTKATGGLVGSQAKVERTERFLSYVGNVVIPRLQEFGGNDSVEELKYLQKVMAGDISLEPNSIKEILADAERKIQRGIARTQKQAEAAGKGQEAPLGPGELREKSVVRSGTVNSGPNKGKKVIEYSDGSREYM